MPSEGSRVRGCPATSDSAGHQDSTGVPVREGTGGNSHPAASDDMILAGQAERGPNVVGATGGSGTRSIARVLMRSGMYIGTNLNRSVDALDFGDYSDRWIDAFLAGPSEGEEVEEAMRADLEATLRRHLHDLDDPDRPWGWKEPRSIFLLPFFHRHLPELRFLHFVRDGRDMAFSSNQQQLRKHGAALLGGLPDAPEPVQSIAVWGRVNLAAARYGTMVLGSRYLRIRFEDLCREPVTVIERVLEFFSLPGEPKRLASEVKPPRTLGRWRKEDSELVAAVERAGAGALAELGY